MEGKPMGNCPPAPHLVQAERRGFATIIVVAIHVQHLRRQRERGQAHGLACKGERTLAITTSGAGPTFRPDTDSRPLIIHSLRPVPSTIASYSSSMSVCWPACLLSLTGGGALLCERDAQGN